MRNLKRVLALAMALVMTLGMMVIGANAASYPDADQIDADYTEAIEVLTGIGVFRGMETGAFAPKEVLNRAQASTLVYRILTGDVTDAKKDLYDYSSFDDVKEGEWYTGYVTYAANGGYVKGYGDGNFGPYDQVTGVQVLAIMLRAIGYGQDGEYVGAAWKDNVLTDAHDLGLLVGIATNDLDKGATRELVAQLLFNAMTIPSMVTHNGLLGYHKTYETLGEKKFSLVEVTGEVTAVNNGKGTTTLTPVGVGANDNALDHANAVVVTNTDADFGKIGYVASVWAVPTPNAKTYTAVSSVTSLGNSLKVTTNGTEVEDSKVVLDTNVRYYLNGIEQVGDTAVKAIDNRIGVKIDYIDNDNGGKAEVVVATQYTVATVTGIATDINAGTNATQEKSYYLDYATAVKTSNLITADDLAVRDLVTYVKYTGTNPADYYVTKVPYTTDKFTQLTRSLVLNNDAYNYAYTIGGADYYKAYAYTTTSEVLVQANLQKTVVIGTDPYGYILTAKLYTDPTAYLYVVENEQTKQLTGLTETSVVFSDGTVAEVNVTGLTTGNTTQKFFSASDDNIYNSNSIAPHIYAYTVDKDGNYALTTVTCQHLAGVNYTAGSAQFGTLGLDSKSVIVDLRPGKVGTVYTGHTGDNRVPSLTNATIHYLAPVDGRITLAYLTNGKNAADLSAEFIAYKTTVNKVLGSARDGYTYLVDLLVGGELVKDYELTQAQYTALTTYGVGHYKFDATGTLTFTAFPEKWVDATWTNNTVTVNGTAYYPYGSVPFYVINVGKEAAVSYTMTNGFDGLYTEGGILVTTAKAYITYNKDNVVTAIYVIADQTNLAETLSPTATMVKDSQTIIYSVDSKKITTPANNNLSIVKVKGVEADLTGGKGTAAAPYTYVAKLTNADINENGSISWLTATAESSTATVNIMHGAPETTPVATGTGTAADPNKANLAGDLSGYYWYVECNGVYYKVTATKVSATYTASNVTELNTYLGKADLGDTIVLAEGTYELNNLTITKDVTIVGANDNVIVKAASGQNAFYMNLAAGKTATLKNLKLVANGTHAVQMSTGCNGNVVIENCEFTNAGTGFGIYKNPQGTLKVTGCSFKDLPVAIGTESTWASMTITGNDFAGCVEALGLTNSALASGETETVIDAAMVANNTNVNAGMVNVY